MQLNVKNKRFIDFFKFYRYVYSKGIHFSPLYDPKIIETALICKINNLDDACLFKIDLADVLALIYVPKISSR